MHAGRIDGFIELLFFFFPRRLRARARQSKSSILTLSLLEFVFRTPEYVIGWLLLFFGGEARSERTCWEYFFFPMASFAPAG